ncbi:type II secretion system protein GspC [Alteromonas sp. ASW11-130]|uniref:type II secretion system protein GspC n=1 Tax=Alteromonas sp. ASW11-130 TaxID=3015775 RepID=UPI002241DBC0|nr:type II secretion system protein GspC [Alteromonas sp. ASW11-130]MCW8093267.1 type II secretion system protein GspC [Alteromonas sp. ASW11-130]
MTFSKFNSQSLVQLFNQHQKQLHLLLVVLLSLYLLAFAARLVWQIIPEPTVSTPPVNIANTSQTARGSKRGGDISQIQRLNLFGEVRQDEQPPVEQVTEAPETQLNLTLTGVVASSLVESGAAIIENRGTQNTYGLGEKIEGTNATLHQVFHDRVIIRNGARHETLMLDGVDFAQAQKRTSSRMIPSNRPIQRDEEASRRISEEAAELAESLRDKPASFTDFISITPQTQDGQLIGYQVRPGKSPELFEAVGLSTGDVIVQINGLDLTDAQQSMEAMNELREAQVLELTVSREGDMHTIYLDLPSPNYE